MATAPVALKAPESRDAPGLDVARIREDFPILSKKVHGKPLAYFDNAATTQNPNQVLDRVRRVYEEEYSNIHRGVHYLSQLSTDAYEGARETVRRFLNAKSTKEIIFLRGDSYEPSHLGTYLSCLFGGKYPAARYVRGAARRLGTAVGRAVKPRDDGPFTLLAVGKRPDAGVERNGAS